MIAAIVSGVLIKQLPLPVVSLLGVVLTSTGVLLAGALYTPTVITYSLGIVSGIEFEERERDRISAR